MIIIINIIQEFLSTNKTIAVVRGETYKAMFLKISLLMVSTLSTVLVVGNSIDKELVVRLTYIAIGTGIGSLLASMMQNRNKKEKIFKFIVKFEDRESADKAANLCKEEDISFQFIGGRTMVIYSETKETSKKVISLPKMLFYEATVLSGFGME